MYKGLCKKTQEKTKNAKSQLWAIFYQYSYVYKLYLSGVHVNCSTIGQMSYLDEVSVQGHFMKRSPSY